MVKTEDSAIDIFVESPLLKPRPGSGGVKVIEELQGNVCHRRYIIDASSGSFRVEDVGRHSQLLLSQRVRDFVFPANFPESVRPEYLTYMLWQLVTHVTGFCSSTLVTSSLLKAVGIGASPLGVGAATAAIKWVTKDGIGAVGSLLIGGRFGGLFDEDPKQWRLYADVIGSVGNILELATPLAPQSFLLLASLGNLTKAVAHGFKEPSWRVIQNHFAAAHNLGDIAAKEEVWKVAGQMAGLACGVVLLGTPGIAASYWTLVAFWFVLRSLHLYLRYRCLHTLCFHTINFKRAAILVRAHLNGDPLPGWEACNWQERILVPRQFTRPRLHFGSTFQTLVTSSNLHPQDCASLLSLYGEEEYLLWWRGHEALVVPKVGCSTLSLLKAMWQAEWAHRKERDRHSSLELGSMEGKSLVEEALRASKDSFPQFMEELEEAGWDSHLLVLRPPPNTPHLATVTHVQN